MPEPGPAGRGVGSWTMSTKFPVPSGACDQESAGAAQQADRIIAVSPFPTPKGGAGEPGRGRGMESLTLRQISGPGLATGRGAAISPAEPQPTELPHGLDAVRRLSRCRRGRCGDRGDVQAGQLVRPSGKTRLDAAELDVPGGLDAALCADGGGGGAGRGARGQRRCHGALVPAARAERGLVAGLLRAASHARRARRHLRPLARRGGTKPRRVSRRDCPGRTRTGTDPRPARWQPAAPGRCGQAAS